MVITGLARNTARGRAIKISAGKISAGKSNAGRGNAGRGNAGKGNAGSARMARATTSIARTARAASNALSIARSSTTHRATMRRPRGARCGSMGCTRWQRRLPIPPGDCAGWW